MAHVGGVEIVKNEDRPDRPGFTDPDRLESGGGGLVSTTHDYARFAQMFLNKGTLAGNTVIKPETVELMRTNAIGELRLYSDGTTANPGLPGVGFGMDFAVYQRLVRHRPALWRRHALLGRRCRHLVLDRSGQRPLLRRHDPVDGRRAS